ncbi:MAG: glycosyltransferase [bacterium]
MMVIAVVIMSDREEPFLPACLESVADAVDLVAINDNGSAEENPNMEAVISSRLYRAKKVRVIKSPFRGFGPARNKCLELVFDLRPKTPWVLMLDCDEVHTWGLTALTRGILPRLSAKTGIVDVYARQFMRTFDYYTAVDIRRNFLFRLQPETRWEGAVREELVGAEGKRIRLPYTFFHYGGAMHPRAVFDNLKTFARYGDPALRMEDLERLDPERFLDGESGRVLNFKGTHPPLAEAVIRLLTQEREEDLRLFDSLVQKARKDPRVRLKNILSELDFSSRVKWSFLQSLFLFWNNNRALRSLGELFS